MKYLITAICLFSLLGCQTTAPVKNNNQPVTKNQVKKLPKRKIPALSTSITKKFSVISTVAETDLAKAEKMTLKVLSDCQSKCNAFELGYVYSFLGWINYGLDENRKSRDYYTLLLEQSPKISHGLESQALLTIAHLSMDLNELDVAEKFLQQYEATYSKSSAYCKARAYLWSHQGKLDDVDFLKSTYCGSRMKLGEGRGDNAEYLPVFKKAPLYPKEAIKNKIEGYCTVAYDVLENGKTANHRAADCPQRVFLEAAIMSAKSFIYVPRLVDGKAVKVENVKNKYTFELNL